MLRWLTRNANDLIPVSYRQEWQQQIKDELRPHALWYGHLPQSTNQHNGHVDVGRAKTPVTYCTWVSHLNGHPPANNKYYASPGGGLLLVANNIPSYNPESAIHVVWSATFVRENNVRFLFLVTDSRCLVVALWSSVVVCYTPFMLLSLAMRREPIGSQEIRLSLSSTLCFI